MKSLRIIILTALVLTGAACEEPLEEQIFSQLAPSTLFTSESGLNSLLNSSYAYAHRSGATATWSPHFLGASPTGELWGQGGSIESLWVQLQDFTWNGTHGQIVAMWGTYYNAIRDANIILDNLDNPKFSADFVSKTTAEARFIRGWSYSELYNLFGPLPIYTSSTDDPLQARATDAATRQIIEDELNFAIANLPATAAFGKGTKGAAMAILCKYYMNTRQWQNAADMAQDIIDLGTYGLETNYADVFSFANEGNDELIWALPKDASNGSVTNNVVALTFPPNYPRPFSNNGVFAARTYLFDAFVNSFEVADTRKNLIVTAWSVGGTPQPALGSNRSFPNKYPWDPNSVGANQGNDVPVIRYSDILLSRAEALNEISGPTQEAIDLINEVRDRAQASLLTLGGFDKASLRDAILRERGWEFFHEGKSREDQIRQGVFISRAVARGKNAQPFHVLYPIPVTELDANKLLEQNEGYGGSN
ncbi:MAG: RagB/SusD family nutrient uptake outer membrane protein [Cyclobacteriaceae bacterium]